MRPLDGLRGLAAMVVVLGHSINASVPSLSAVNVGRPVSLNGVEEVLAYSPLHLFYAGQDWVIVFFVLSGFVLSLAASSGARFIASRYYPSRFVRLYVPVWGGLVVAAVAHIAISHASIPGATSWLNAHSAPLSVGHAVHDATLIFGAGDGSFSTVLWSLQWEVLFSLLLPLYLAVGRRLGLTWGIGLSLLVILLGAHRSPYAHYLPPFMLGVVLAYNRASVQELSRRRAGFLLAACLVCLPAGWWLPGGEAQNVGLALTGASALGLIVCALNAGQFGDFLSSRPLQLVGRRSFSLYLVHEPLVVAAAFALGGRPSVVVLLLVALPIVAVVTEIFFRLVERPSHTLAHRAADWGAATAQQVLALRTTDGA